MKKIIISILALVVAVTIMSCSDGDSSVYYNGYVAMEAGPLPDTMHLNTTYTFSLIASASNSCWHNLEFLYNNSVDFVYSYAASGVFENNGETCEQDMVVKDTTIVFTPEELKTLIFRFYSYGAIDRVDTVVVVEAE